MKTVDARNLIALRGKEFSEQEINFVVESSSQNLSSDFESLGLFFDKEANSALLEVNQNPFILNLSEFNPLKKKIYAPIFKVDPVVFNAKSASLFGGFEKEVKEASVEIVSGQFRIKEGEKGHFVNRSKLIADLNTRLRNFSTEPIEVETVSVEPKVQTAGAQKALEKVKGLEGQKITLYFKTDTWSLSGKRLLSILEFSPKGHSEDFRITWPFIDDQLGVSEVYLVDSVNLELEVSLDSDALAKFIAEIASDVFSAKNDATLKFDGGKISAFTPARDGQRLDSEKTRDLVLEKVSIDNIDSSREIRIALPVNVEKARIANEEINSLGIKELLGSGVSYFSGSITNRIYNVGLGSSRISGTLVKPGETFSFNQAVGEVSGATGYRQAYVISAGRTVLDDGGGICQVSSTAFRAALNAGLPIVARTAHAYRVGYYEQGGFKAGMDATVWSPAVDFKFKNDTQNHILVQAIFDPSRAKLQVDIYGTQDDRRVELTQPVLSNIKPAPEPKYQDDPSLPKGTVKQVDFAAAGAVSIFSRKVYKGDELVIDDTFKSNFRPWQAIYLVGTGG